MAVDIRREILQNLYENQLTDNYNIMPYLNKACPDIILDHIRKYLTEMQEDDVVYPIDPIQVSNLYGIKENTCKSYEGRIEVRIKHAGIAEIQEYLLTEQTRLVNESLIITNGSIVALNSKTDGYYYQLKLATWVIAISTVFTTLFSILTFLRTRPQSQPQQLTLPPETEKLLIESLKERKANPAPALLKANDSSKKK
jgi:hypothetical protein